MNYSKQYINEIAQKSGFLANNTEKVIRLLDVLKFINEELNRISHQLMRVTLIMCEGNIES